MINSKTIAITRHKDDSREFIKLVVGESAIPLCLPTIKLIKKQNIVKLFLNDIDMFEPDFSIFMSAKAVKLLFDDAKINLKYEKLQLAVSNTIVVAIGPKTKTALKNEGISVSYLPKRYSSVGLGEILTKLDAVGKKVIIPRSSAATPFLSDLLEKIGLKVKENYIYDTCTCHNTSVWDKFFKLFLNSNVDGIIFTSSLSVKSFFEIMLKYCDKKTIFSNLQNIKIVSIGPFTSYELAKFNVKNTVSSIYTVLDAFKTIKKMF